MSIIGSRELLFYRSQSNDPYFNLALEQHIFDRYSPGYDVFMLWQNENTIVIGKNQNAAAEINLPYVEENSVKVARRLSGGGAVYHDMGNLNFTFVTETGDSEPGFGFFCLPVADTLKKLGVAAEIQGRNDILIGGRKFSGNAQYRKDGRIMHHGTIMFDSDLDVVRRALSVRDDKLSSKGIRSVRSRVTNVSEHLPAGTGLADFEKLLTDNILTGGYKRFEPSDDDMAEIARLRDEVYSTWEWVFGRSPRYETRRAKRIEGCGLVEFYLSVKNGRIAAAECFGDYFGSGDFSPLAERLTGVRLVREDITAAIQGIDIGDIFMNLTAEGLADILTTG